MTLLFGIKSLAFLEADLCVRAITQGFVLRGAAAAQGDAVADFKRLSVSSLNRNAASGPDRPVWRESDFFGQVWLDALALRLDRIGQRSLGTAIDHRHDLSPHLRIVTALGHLPNIGDAVTAKAGVNTQRGVILEGHVGARIIALAAGASAGICGFGAVEFFPMSAVTERFVG
jgi:hypothetical protein